MNDLQTNNVKNTMTTQYKSVKNTVKILSCFFFLFIISCTAYFNTFYNAEIAFREGHTAHEILMRNYPDSLIVAPTAEIVIKYDRAIDKANKTIESFQKKKKWHDDALFLMGKAYYFKKEMEKAIYRFRQLEREFPESKYIAPSQLFIARAYIEEENLDKAEEVLLNAKKKYPELNKDQQISLLMITIAIRRNGKSQAITLLEDMLKTLKSDQMKLDVYLRTAELYIDLKQYQKAILLLNEAPRKKDYPVQVYRIDRALFVCYQAVDSLQNAMELIDKMIGNKTYAPFMDEMLFNKGLLLFTLGEIDESIKIFKKLTAGTDSTNIGSDTSTFKGKAFFELARIYQQQKEDYEKAYLYYKLASSSRDTTSRGIAGRFISAMERLKKLREEIAVKDTTHGGSRFTIGELFKFDLNEPDSAYNQFLLLCTDSTTDSLYIPKAMLQAAVLAKHDMHNEKSGDSLLKVILERYPATDYAKEAQAEMGLPVTIATRSDSAAMKYRHAEELFYRENNVKDAIQEFYDIARDYSELEIAPKSLFAAAWLSSSVLFKKKTAKMLYEKICSSYSESIYCTDVAKPKIKVVIDTLEKLDQIRRSNAAAAELNQNTKKTVKNSGKEPVQVQKQQIQPAAVGTVVPNGQEKSDMELDEDSVNKDILDDSPSKPSASPIDTGLVKPE